METGRQKRIRGKAVPRVPMTVHFDREEYAAMVVKANGTGCSMQQIVRAAVRQALKVADRTEVRP